MPTPNWIQPWSSYTSFTSPHTSLTLEAAMERVLPPTPHTNTREPDRPATPAAGPAAMAAAAADLAAASGEEDASMDESQTTSEQQPRGKKTLRRADARGDFGRRDPREAAGEEQTGRVTRDAQRMQQHETRMLYSVDEKNIRRYIQENETLRREVEGLRREVARQQGLEGKLEEMQKLLQTRSAELREAHAYLAHPDSVSHADILRHVQQLNSEIYQVSAQITNSLVFNNGHNIPDGELEALRKDISAKFGKVVAELLSHVRQGTGENIAVQMVLQSLLSRSVAVVADAWNVDTRVTWEAELGDACGDVDPSTPTGPFLRSLYDKIFRSESQGVSSRWRVLTQQYVKQLQTDATPLDVVFGTLLDTMWKIVIFSGASPSSSPLGNVEGKVKEILTLSWKLRELIGEMVTSSDFRILCPRYRQDFQHFFMDDVFATKDIKPSELEAKGAKVLLTMDLGLLRYDKSKAQAGGTEVIKSAVPLKAKILLVTAKDELITEQSSGSTNKH